MPDPSTTPMPSSPASSAALQPASHGAGSDTAALVTGRTPSGDEFTVVPTIDMFRTLVTPSRWGGAELLTNGCMLLQLMTIPLIRLLPLQYYVLTFLFWRVMYNVGIAVVLHYQSRAQIVTKAVAALSPDATALLNWLVTKSVGKPYNWSTSPPAFNAWLAFRAFATLVLANDGMSYFVLMLASFTSLRDTSMFTNLLVVLLSIPLFALSFWSKAAAHKCLGDFAWFWGDFFFTIDSELVMDGVFALFPHPMYTVGYTAYYASALVCRSYTLLLVSLFAHCLQIAFLMFIEEPHMQSIYGGGADAAKSSTVEYSSDDPAMRLFDQAAPHSVVVSALSLAFFSVLFLLFGAAPCAWITIPLTLLLRVVYWQGLAYMLGNPTNTDNRWVTILRKCNTSHSRIFTAWQHALLVFTAMNHTLFAASAIALRSDVADSLFSARRWAHMLGGICLIAMGAVSQLLSYQAGGTFATYYGDFFVQAEGRPAVYKGIYQYINHPDAALGYLVYYGLACLARSYGAMVIALICQMLHLLFVSGFEMPHMRGQYNTLREESPWVSALRSLPAVDGLVKKGREVVAKVSTNVMEKVSAHIVDVNKLIAVRLDRIKSDADKSYKKCMDAALKNCTDAKERAVDSTKGMTAAKVILQFRKFGMKIDPVHVPKAHVPKAHVPKAHVPKAQ